MTTPVNPYIAGNPVTGEEMFFGRDDVFDFIRQTLVGRHQDNIIVLYGQRRTGKTSVLYQMHRRLDETYMPVLIDLQGLSMDGMSGFLWEVANIIRRTLRRGYGITIPRPQRGDFADDPRHQFEEVFLPQLWDLIGDRRLMLMFDEAVRLEEQVAAGRLQKDIFDYLRHLMQHGERLRFIFSLGSKLEEMQKEYAVLFSVALYRTISFLERDAAVALITEPVEDVYEYEPAAVDRILQITSGHPYFTQLLCGSLFLHWQRNGRARVTVSDVDSVLDEVVEQGTAILKYAWEESSDADKAVLAALEKRGLAVRDGSYRLFSTAFADWIMAEATDTASDDQTYEEWLDENEALLDRVGRRARGTVEQLLPQIKGAYRGLLINWFSDPRIAEEAAPLLLDALEYHRQQWLREHEEAIAPPAPAQRHMAYCNFDLAIDNRTHRGYPIRARSEMGEARAVMALDPASTEMVEALGKLAADDVNEDYLSRTGARLYENLLSGDVGALLEATVGRATARDEGVRIRLTIEPPEMAALPWELLCSRATGDFLATSTKTLLARYVEVQTPLRDLRVSPPIKMLGIIPRGSGLDVGAEKMVLQEALDKLDDTVQLTWLEGAVSTTHISDVLLENGYHIVHYIGHGVFERDQGYLAINDEASREHLINERQFARLFLNYPSVKLIVLNACQGATVSATRPFVGIAPQLVRRGIPAVIAMQYPVYDDVSLRFAREFYRCLCVGPTAGQVDTAVSYARNQLCIHFPNERAVATPVLFLRAPDGVIFDLS